MQQGGFSSSKRLISFEPRCEKTGFCIWENKDADQLRGHCEADQCLCFRYMDSTIPLLSKVENFKPLAIFCGSTVWVVSDLVGNPRRPKTEWLIYGKYRVHIHLCLFNFLQNVHGKAIIFFYFLFYQFFFASS